ncbi:glycosyltransferase [Candidatus Latescibacterota bacterium]
MRETDTVKNVLILLIGEILEDPRVYRTAVSLSEWGARVIVACTNPYRKPSRETHKNLSIVRFPHRKVFFLKKLYNWLQSRLHPGMGEVLSRAHEDVPSSPVKTALRNYLLTMNFKHFMKSNMKINRMMIDTFAGQTFDLVHCNDVDTLFAGSALKKNGTARSVLYDSHEYWSGIGVHGSQPNDALREIETEGINHADYVVTVNPMIADLLKEQYQLKEIPSVVMNCPYIYEGEIHTDKVHSPVRMIYQGKLQAFRGLAELVLAFKHIDNGTLTLSGYGPLEEHLKRIAESEGLTDKVTFTGRYKPDSALPILAEHDIGIMPFSDVTLSIVYSSPNKLFDYAMAGLAVAASNLPFLNLTIKDNGMGNLFDSLDSESIAETLNAMIVEPDRLKTCKVESRKAALSIYNWEKQIRNYPWRP